MQSLSKLRLAQTLARPAQALIGILFAVPAAWAAPDEITVFLDDIQKRGTVGFALHANYVPSGPRDPGHEGARPSNRALRLMPEIAFGLGGGWELAPHFPVSRSSGENFRSDGVKLRLKYSPVRPEGEDEGFFWGGNVEIARYSRRFAEDPNALELKLIGGWRSDHWLIAGNINTGRALGAGVAPQWHLAPSAKVAYSVTEHLALGAERYHDFDHLGTPRSRERITYLVADVSMKRFSINFGIGRGSGIDADKWVAKMVIGMQL